MDVDDNDDGVQIFEEDLQQENPQVLENQNPAFLVSTFMSGKLFLEQYGWFLLFGFILLMILYNWFEPYLKKWLQKREDRAYYSKYDGQTFQETYSAMQRAREKMQMENNLKTEVFVQEEKKREEKKRQQRLEKLEGKSSKLNLSSPVNQSEPKPKPKSKTKIGLNSDYLPMGGSSGSSTYRPSRRFAGG